MLITCPECQFARNINTDSIPAKAQLATCPRCQTKFRFRILPEEESFLAEQQDESAAGEAVVETVPEVSEDTLAEVLSAVEDAEKLTQDIETPASVVEDLTAEEGEIEEAAEEEPVEVPSIDEIDNFMDGEDALQDAISDDILDVAQDDAVVAEEAQEAVDEFAELVDESAAQSAEDLAAEPQSAFEPEDSAEFEEGIEDEQMAKAEEGAEGVRRSASAQALRDRQVYVKIDNSLEAEEKAVQRYAKEQESSAQESVAAHIVAKNDTLSLDIWDTIAAMGDDSEAVDSDLPAGGAIAHVIPWEDTRLSGMSRVASTVGGMFAHPVTFWRGINARESIVPAMAFFALACLVSVFAIVGWVQVVETYWTQITAFLQPILAQQGVPVPVLVLPVLAPPVLVALVVALAVVPFVLGGVTHAVAKVFGGSSASYSSGFKSVAYSSGAFVWTLVPVVGIFFSAIYLVLLYIHGVRTGYNLSLMKSVVTVLTVSLLLTATVLMILTAGVSLM